MVDHLSPAARSWNMSRVRGKDTSLEMRVRKAVFAYGFRYRLHDKKLPGKPDLVFPRYRLAVFVHGCFWHGHDCPRGRRPSSNTAFWDRKITANIARDRRACAELAALGYQMMVLWQCTIDADLAALLNLLQIRRDGSAVCAR